MNKDMVRDMIVEINKESLRRWNEKVVTEEAGKQKEEWEERAWDARVDFAKDLLAMAGFVFAFIFVMAVFQ